MPDRAPTARLVWHRVAALDELPEGRVNTVAGRPQEPRAHALRRSVRRARQPLPASRRSARRRFDREGLAALPVARLRLLAAHRHAAARIHRRARVLPGRGARRRHLRRPRARVAARPHRVGCDGRDDVRVGCDPRVRHGRALQPRIRRRDALGRAPRRPHVHRHPPRGRGRVRGVGVRQAHRPARGVLRDRGSGIDQSPHRPVRRQGRSLARARDLGAGAVEGARPRRVPGSRSHRRVLRRRVVLAHGATRFGSRRVDEPGVQARTRAARRLAPRTPRRSAGTAGRRREAGYAERPHCRYRNLAARGDPSNVRSR